MFIAIAGKCTAYIHNVNRKWWVTMREVKHSLLVSRHWKSLCNNNDGSHYVFHWRIIGVEINPCHRTLSINTMSHNVSYGRGAGEVTDGMVSLHWALDSARPSWMVSASGRTSGRTALLQMSTLRLRVILCVKCPSTWPFDLIFKWVPRRQRRCILRVLDFPRRRCPLTASRYQCWIRIQSCPRRVSWYRAK